MTRKTKAETCSGCGQRNKLGKLEGHLLCPDCQTVIKTLRTHPDSLAHLLAIAGIEQADPPATSPAANRPEKSRDLPDVLDAVRYRTTDRERNTWYVSVSELEGNPVEVFASTAFDRDHHLQSRISNLTTITRLISLILRHVFLGEVLTLEKTLTQLHRSSRQKNDLPDMLAQVLSNYTSKQNQSLDREIDTP